MNKLLVHITIGILIACAAVAAEDVAAPSAEETAATEALGRNVRLDFRLLPLEKDNEEVFVVTASSWYETALRFEGPEIELEFAVSGTIELVDSGKILIQCDVELVYEGKDTEAEISTLCSAILKPGVDLEIAKMGDRTLVVRATFIE